MCINLCDLGGVKLTEKLKTEGLKIKISIAISIPEKTQKTFYKNFVTKVANNRGHLVDFLLICISDS